MHHFLIFLSYQLSLVPYGNKRRVGVSLEEFLAWKEEEKHTEITEGNDSEKTLQRSDVDGTETISTRNPNEDDADLDTIDTYL